MIIARPSEAKGYLTPPPHPRELKVLLSPSLQEDVEGLAIGMTILAPGESSSAPLRPAPPLPAATRYLVTFPCTRLTISSASEPGTSSYRPKCMVKLPRPCVRERSSVA